MEPNTTTASVETPALEPSAVTSTTLEGTSVQTADPQSQQTTEQRLNNLMSKWQTEEGLRKQNDAEVSRLQTLLAEAVVREATLKQQLAEAGTGSSEATSAAEKRATDAEARVKELEASVAKDAGELAKLRFLAANADLIQYASILPQTANVAALEAAAVTIRNARQADTQQIREHSATPRGPGGQPSRSGRVGMTPAEIKAYLDPSLAPAEYEKRLKEVTGQ